MQGVSGLAWGALWKRHHITNSIFFSHVAGCLFLPASQQSLEVSQSVQETYLRTLAIDKMDLAMAEISKMKSNIVSGCRFD